jgi:hypothetical protein
MRKRPGMNLWPREIADSEAIVRGICSHYHVKKGKLQLNAYRPPADREDVSVMRCDWIGANGCKQHAKDIEDPTSKPPKFYQGMAVLSAKHIRDTGARVVDSREQQFDGHADILHGIKFVRGEPPPRRHNSYTKCKSWPRWPTIFPIPTRQAQRGLGRSFDTKIASDSASRAGRILPTLRTPEFT